MQCPQDDTELEVYTGSIDIFGPGSCILQCPTCQEITGYSETGTYSLGGSERKLILNGLRAQICRVPPMICFCPHCGELLKIEKRPPAVLGTFRKYGVDKIAYIYLEDGEKVCTCYECSKKFHVFSSSIISLE